MKKSSLVTILVFLISLFAFSPVYAEWTVGPDIPDPRAGIMAAFDDKGVLYVFGGMDTYKEYDLAHILTTDGNWEHLETMPYPLYVGDAAWHDGLMYIAGGISDGVVIPTLLIYDWYLDGWNTGAPMPEPRYGHSLDVLEDRLLLCGGGDETFLPRNECWSYDPVNDSWTQAAPMTYERMHHSTTLVDQQLYVFGGNSFVDPDPLILVKGEAYSTVLDSWSAISDLPVSFTHGIAEFDGESVLLCYGMQGPAGSANGFPVEESADCFAYDTNADIWGATDSPDYPRYGLAGAQYGGTIYAIGGLIHTDYGEEYQDVIEIWTPEFDDDDDDTGDDDDYDDVDDDDDDVSDDDDDDSTSLDSGNDDDDEGCCG